VTVRQNIPTGFRPNARSGKPVEWVRRPGLTPYPDALGNFMEARAQAIAADEAGETGVAG
jgi:hypothetical protein